MPQTPKPGQAPPLPAVYPRTATQLLLARDTNPFDEARQRLHDAWQALSELAQFLPDEQRRLKQEFDKLAAGIRDLHEHARMWLITQPQLDALRKNPPPGWGEAIVSDGAPVAPYPVPRNHQEEPVFGFAAAFGGLQEELRSVTNAATTPGPTGSGLLHALHLAGRAALLADHAYTVAAVFTAAVWDFERPGMPMLAAASGRIELRPYPRSAPHTRWARYSRAMFLKNRVELTTSDGRVLIGDQSPIAYLMHVVPPSPTTAQVLADPAESQLPVPHYEALGTIHFCTEDGYSLGAIAVADWTAQPQAIVNQPRLTGTDHDQLRQHRFMVWGLEAAGIVAGAAVLEVPIRRGVAHPPMHQSVAPTAGSSGTPQSSTAQSGTLQQTGGPPDLLARDPAPGVRLLRPSPQLLPYSPPGTSRGAARRRRSGNRFIVGPASPLQPWLQWLAAPAISLAALALLFTSQPGFWTYLWLSIALLAAAEPWLWWLAQWLRDRDWRTMTAVYHPGKSEAASNRFARYAELRFDGSSIGVRGADGHEAWIAASSDEDLGATALLRLQHDGDTWGFAFTDRLGRWRLVLPAAEWVPSGDLTALAGFAQRAGLELGNANATPDALDLNLFAGRGTERQRRSRGPYSRGMLWTMYWALGAFAVTLPAASHLSHALLLVIGLVAGVPVIVRALLARWLDRRP